MAHWIPVEHQLPGPCSFAQLEVALPTDEEWRKVIVGVRNCQSLLCQDVSSLFLLQRQASMRRL